MIDVCSVIREGKVGRTWMMMKKALKRPDHHLPLRQITLVRERV